MSERFFATVVVRGRLHVRGIGDSGPWDRKWLRYRTEPQIEVNFNPHNGDRKVRTLEELQAVISEAADIQVRNVWIHENLEDEGAARKPIHPVGESPTRGVAQLAAVVLSGV